MDCKPKMSIDYAIGCLEDLSNSILPYSQDKDYKDLLVAISMGIRALRKTTVEDIYDFSDIKSN